MQTYLFRTINGRLAEGYTQEIGLLVAADSSELFWMLDELGNPYDYEFTEARPGDALHTFQQPADDDDVGEALIPNPKDVFYVSSQPAPGQTEFDTISELLSGTQGERVWRCFSESTFNP